MARPSTLRHFNDRLARRNLVCHKAFDYFYFAHGAGSDLSAVVPGSVYVRRFDALSFGEWMAHVDMAQPGWDDPLPPPPAPLPDDGSRYVSITLDRKGGVVVMFNGSSDRFIGQRRCKAEIARLADLPKTPEVVARVAALQAGVALWLAGKA
jgi:hypothetical protein